MIDCGKSRCGGGRQLGQRRGFTLMEMLVAVAVVGVLIALLMPALGRARESARDNECRGNLRQLGVGLHQYAETHSSLCSGAFDWCTDGCVVDYGWVADLVGQGLIVGELRCPSSPYQLSEQYNELLTKTPADILCADALGSHSLNLPDGSVVKTPCQALIAGDRATILAETFLPAGLNTNYAASWFLVRSDAKVDATGALVGDAGCPPALMDRSGTVGPLPKARMGNGRVSSSHVPMLGCAGPAKGDNSALLTDIGEFPAGTLLADSHTDGPVDRSTMKAPATGGSGTWLQKWQWTLQDYRDFGPVHGGRNGSCNILFLDGSVRAFVDTNGDGQLNNGFPATASNGFAGDEIELLPSEVYSGWSLNPARLAQ